jgi:hypothetical protein
VNIRIRNQQDFVAGLFFAAIAAGALWIAWGYPLGTAVRMNAGYFPRLLGFLLLGLGLIIVAGSLRVDGPALTPVNLRALVMIPAAVIAFGFATQYLGFVIAAVLVTVFGSFASPEMRLGETLIASLVLTLFAIGIFIWGVGLPIPLWPEF